MILTLLAEPTAGGLLFLTLPGPPDDAERVLVDSVEVSGAAIHALADGRNRVWRSSLGFHWVVADVPLRCDSGIHELTIVDGGRSWELPINTHSVLDGPLIRPMPLSEWLAGDGRPEVSEGRSGFPVLQFPASVLGLVVWSAGGQLLAVMPETQVYVRWGEPVRQPEGIAVIDLYYPLWAPVAVRAILADSTLGPAWYVDADLQVAEEPEVEDGRYQLFNTDGSVRWSWGMNARD